MHVGQTLIAKTASDTQVFSPWFPREADNAIFTYEVIQDEDGAANFTVTLYDKNTEDPGEGDPITDVSFSQIGSTRFYKAEAIVTSGGFVGFQEMVRFGYKLTMSESGSRWVLHRMLTPNWFDTAEA